MKFNKTTLKKMKKDELIGLILSMQNQFGSVQMNNRGGLEVIQDFEWNNPRATKIIKINDKKFKIVYNNSNGRPLGFNYKFSASVMDGGGEWKYVAEKADIGYNPVSYVNSEEVRKEDAKRFIRAMENYLIKVYG